MSIPLQFINNPITTFVYEPFSYTISNPGPYTLTISNSSGIPPGYLVNNGSNVVFSATSNVMGVGTESFVITARSGSTVVATSSNTVDNRAGRFRDASGNSYSGNYTFYKNEPITPIRLLAPFAITTPTSIPSLPPGLTYVSNASNDFSITGSPLTTVPLSNYIFIGTGTGTNLGKVVTSRFGIVISNERMLLNLSGSPIVSPMSIGTPIVDRTITAAFPPYPSSGTLRYTWSGLPDGIYVTDVCGNVRSSGFLPTDASYSLVVTGTPTLAAANAFRNANISSNTVTFTATRVAPAPVISNEVNLTFAFGETVLFDTVSVPVLYNGVTIPPGSIFYRAQTYFGSGSAISNIFSPDLRSDLSLSFIGSGRADLSGTPTSPGTATYTIRATNSNGVSRDLLSTIAVSNDTISFAPLVDTCLNYIISRPASLPLTGYYPASVQFQATAASGKPVTFSSTGLAGTGLSLSNVSANVVQIVGIPDRVTPLSTVTVTANAVGTPATGSVNFSLAVLDDTITVADVSASLLTFIQNREITPIQLSATTLSERPVTSFTSLNLPAGLTLSPTGRIIGTPTGSTGGTFTVNASTGYSSQNKVFSYTITPDSIVLIERPSPSYPLTLGGPIPAATVSGLSYSGTAVSNFVFNSLPVTYGLTINSSTGVFGGTLTTSVEPDPVIPSNVNFFVQGQAGLLTDVLPAELNTSNAPAYEWFIIKGITLGKSRANLSSWTSLSSGLTSNIFTDHSIRPITVTSRSIVAVTHNTDVVQSSNGTDFALYSIPQTPWPFYDTPGAPSAPGPDYMLNMGPNVIARVSNTTTLYGTGWERETTQLATFWKSTDDGVSWTLTFPLLANGVAGRSWLSNAVSYGNAIAYKNGILLIGGNGNATSDPPIIRSTDQGSNWNAVSGGLTSWVNNFSTDASRWVVTGSDDYFPGGAYSTPSRTIRYSDNQGASWTLATSGDFNYMGESITYGNGTWIVGGRHADGGGILYFALRSSTNGSTWSTFTLPGTWFPAVPPDPITGPFIMDFIDSINYDGESFNITITRNNDGSLSQFLFSHLADGSSLASGWTGGLSTSLSDLDGGTDPDLGTLGGARTRRLKGRIPVALSQPSPVLFFPSQSGNGPTITSPSQTSYLFYQYVPITPIVFTASGTGQIYYFVDNATLPRGIAFDPVTATFSGTPVLLGDVGFTLYVKDNSGVTIVNISTTTIIPRVIRQQTSAGAWTSLVRQYTTVNAAQNSVNGHVLPANERILGEFMRPEPADSVSAEGNPNCVKKC